MEREHVQVCTRRTGDEDGQCRQKEETDKTGRMKGRQARENGKKRGGRTSEEEKMDMTDDDGQDRQIWRTEKTDRRGRWTRQTRGDDEQTRQPADDD